MCGIAGIVSLDGRGGIEEARLRRMRDALRHRGPDGEGLVVDGPVGLAHRRLAIIDPAGGGQPMTNEDGSLTVVLNGEIYNHPELRIRLEERGHRYASWCDTETVLHLYEEEGDASVERLSGMFAFALWDAGRRRLLLARDRLGIKPLYYAIVGGELLFASEIKALLAGGVRARLDEAVLPSYLANRFVPGEETFFRGVKRLRPGRTLTWSLAEGLRERRYWSLTDVAAEAPGPDSPEFMIDRAIDLRLRLQAAVRSQLMSDVPLGVFLSGGIDSSGLLALTARLMKRPVPAFAVGFEEREANELAYARLAARSVGADYHEVVVPPGEFWRALPRLLWHEDEPLAFPSSVPLFFVARLAREHVKVVLTGEGADELFLGYNRYRVSAWNERLGRAWYGLVPGSVQRGMGRLVSHLPRRLRRITERSFLALPPGPRSLFFENFAVFPERLQRRLLAEKDLLEDHDPYAEGIRCYEEVRDGPLERMIHADLQTYLVRLLTKQDKMSMAASVESRVPYLDQALVEHVMAMPGRFKLRGLRTKAVLREALRDLVPREILTRRKMGFPVPVGRWLRGPFWSLVEELVLGPRALARKLFDPAFLRCLALEHRAGVAEHGDRLWLLLNLEIWLRVFVDGDAAGTALRAA